MSRVNDKVAIIGAGCRLPGGANDLGKFWDLLVQAKNVVSEIPRERWHSERFCSDNAAAAAKSYVRRGHFIDWDYRGFDAGFFHFAPREVEYLDPQQRLLLEVAWEAMEHAGLDPTRLAGSEVGVYMGGFTVDHMLNQLGSGGRSVIGAHSAAGATLTMLSNRISYAFDFHGPSISIDTACSSSLVAFSYAVNDMLAGNCEMALAGGVNFMLRPEYPIAMSKGQFLARDGRSKSFDSRGDGYGRGEGAGVVVLKPLGRALQDKDRILAVVDGAGVNQDGRTQGITVPNPDAQVTLMRRVVAAAGIDPRTVQYVEAHGTGTPVGDPIEASAISRVYGKERETPCRIGSLKSNVGHLEAAAGVAGIIKACLMLQENEVPALATLERPNPQIPFGENGLALADRHSRLAPADTTPRVAVNSFGYGGTNAHVILSLPRQIQQSQVPPVAERHHCCHLLPLSARDDQALTALAAACAQRLRGERDSLQDILYTLSRRRAQLTHRLAVWGADRKELAEALESFAQQGQAAQAAKATQPVNANPRPVFVFTGMGPQWWGMGQELYREHAIFRAAVDRADARFRELAGFSIRAEMLKDEATSRIQQTRLAQPANFVLQYALTEALCAAGLSPAAVVGHSVGEVTSAWASGMLSLSDALQVAYRRSQAQSKAAGQGGMLAVGLGYAQVLELLADYPGKVSVAAVNSPTNLTLSGDQACLDRIQARLESQEIFARPLTVEVPYHSPMMDPLKPELMQCLASLRPQEPRLPLYSTVSGQRVVGQLYDAAYWCRNVREPVFFDKAIRAMLDDGYGLFLEVGPHPVLRNVLKEIFSDQGREARALQTLNRKQPEAARFNQALAEAFVHGAELDWARRHPAGRLVDLPSYPWQRQPLWIESEHQRRDRLLDTERPLLGVRDPCALRWRADLADHRLAYLLDHVVDDAAIMPAAAYLEAMLEASASQQTRGEQQGWRLRDVHIDKALLLDPQRPLFLETCLDAASRNIELHSFDDHNPTQVHRHARARPYPVLGHHIHHVDLTGLLAQFETPQPASQVYRAFADFAMQYQAAFQAIGEVRKGVDGYRALARLQLPQPLADGSGDYLAHPSLLDGCFQTVLTLLDPKDGAFLPTRIDDLRVYRPLSHKLWCLGELTQRRKGSVTCDLTLIGEDGAVEANIRGLVCVALQGKRSEREYPAGDHVYRWSRQGLGSNRGALRNWLVLSDEPSALAEALCERLRQQPDCSARLLAWQEPQTRQVLAKEGCDAVAFLSSAGFDESRDPTGEVAATRLLQTLQILAARAQVPRCYVITRSAFAVGDRDAPPIPAQGALVGLRRVAFNELGNLWPTTVDLPRLLDDNLVADLVDELLADDEKDEIALRQNGRHTSKLEASGTFAETPETQIDPAAGEPFTLQADAATGAIKLVGLRTAPLPADELELRLEALSVDGAALTAGLLGAIEGGRLMGVCGRVTRVGEGIEETAVGERLCGVIPLALSSHVRVSADRSLLLPVPEEPAAQDLAGDSVLQALALRIADTAALTPNDRVLVCSSPLGLALAARLRARGIQVESFPAKVELWTSAQLEALVRGGPIDAIAAPLNQWEERFGFAELSPGGCLIDLGQGYAHLHCDARIGRLVRIDPDLELGRNRRQFRAALQQVFSGDLATQADSTSIDLPGFIEQKLEAVAELEHLILRCTSDRPLAAQAVDFPDIRADACYLVTGGFGGLGKEIAKWLASQGAGQVALCSRSAGTRASDQAFLQQLVQMGCAASAHACDLAVADQVNDLVQRLAQGDMALQGIFHAAGLIDDRPITDMTEQALRKVMRPKAQGAWNLHLATRRLPLDHFVLFSSISVLVGNSKQANYCAANGFLDALAHHRRAHQLAGLSINWGAIERVGMLSQDPSIGQQLRQIGLTPIAFDLALNGMERALSMGLRQITIASNPDWGRWAGYETYGARSARFRALVEQARAQADNSVQARLRGELSALNDEQRHQVLTGLIGEIFARQLKMPAEQLDASLPLEYLGVDSLMATDIRMELDTALGIAVPALELIGEGSIAGLALKALDQMQLEVTTAA
jgi:acyl transferase domain-containing protein/NAD(P)-dependent dehydrogenase (short-subunit alcohol dehydrogenase family)/acyl carrier protein